MPSAENAIVSIYGRTQNKVRAEKEPSLYNEAPCDPVRSKKPQESETLLDQSRS